MRNLCRIAQAYRHTTAQATLFLDAPPKSPYNQNVSYVLRDARKTP